MTVESSGSAYIVGWGAEHPAGRLTNADLVARLDTTNEWIDRHVGISERRISLAGDTVASLGAAALAAALDRAGLAIPDVDLLIGATAFDDHDMPAAAARIADAAGSSAFTFDVRAACSGWPVGVEVARAMLAAGGTDTVAVVASDRTGPNVDPDDRASVVFFGDAAGATIVTTRPRPGRPALLVVDTEWHADNTEHGAVRIAHGDSFAMDGAATRRWVEKAMNDAAGQVLTRNGIRPEELRALVCHQANLRLLERFAAGLGVAPDRHWHNVEWAGNTGAAGAPTSLAQGLDAPGTEMRDGDHVLVVTVGAGLNVVATLLRWVAP